MLFKTQSIKLILPSSTKFYNLYLFHHHTPFISKTKHDLLRNCIKKKEKTLIMGNRASSILLDRYLSLYALIVNLQTPFKQYQSHLLGYILKGDHIISLKYTVAYRCHLHGKGLSSHSLLYLSQKFEMQKKR